ncbi:sialate O-acetylesterase [Asticcacaulis sp. BYS171W]|uniref:Sialate O-acetylesterase n=1 Tax=Asticcacaulis aquaticus TaxID=2984212 RepID=A0ABT5HTQ9_9CAUL|nr:sialate O-acetylesterase [Asticcacaulis aquaticus]MDC7683461.1 sialate O-acetylesterase [Asticcacaulis aquaticus]
MKRFAFLTALMALIVAPAQAEPPKNMDIYLLMGQSNMSGRGDLSALPDAARGPFVNIWLYGNDGVWKPAADPLDSSTGQIDAVSNELSSKGEDKAGVGPGLSFAKALNTRRPVGLVTCAKGGSSLAQWKPNPARDKLYGSCLARAKEAAGKGTIVGVLWYQGETDGRSVEAANTYGERLTNLITQVRADLEDACLPWVIVGLADQPDPTKSSGYTAWPEVQAQQKALKLNRVGYVTAADLPKNSDDLHLTTGAQLVLGPKLAREMQRVQQTKCR